VKHTYWKPRDWRYRLVDLADNLFHLITPKGWSFPPLCNLERDMWYDRYDRKRPAA
jgi:hypothetical protein